jgi:hypothetical protein
MKSSTTKRNKGRDLVPFKGKLPPPPKSVKIKAAQRLRPHTGGDYFAVRYIFEQHSGMEIRTGGRIVPIPEFGAMAYNWELHGLAAFEWNLDKPIDKDGIKAWHRAEVWHTHDGQATQLAEEWLASEIPAGLTFVQFIFECIEAEQKQRRLELAKVVPKPAESMKKLWGNDEQMLIDHRRNVREVCERLLRREYPQTFRSLDQKASNEETRKAFIADNISNTGVAPEAEDLEKLLHDPSFIDCLSRAFDKRGHKVPPEEWTLACGWGQMGLLPYEQGGSRKGAEPTNGFESQRRFMAAQSRPFGFNSRP